MIHRPANYRPSYDDAEAWPQLKRLMKEDWRR